MPALRWGILSTARINRRFVPALQLSEGSTLQAIASREKRLAEEFARQWNLPRTYSSYRSLLEDPDIDAVYVPLPNHLHRHWCLAAARAGKHILCEKPLGLSSAEVEEMQEMASKCQVHLVEAFQFLTHPLMRILQQEVSNPDLGTIQFIRGHFSYTLSDPDNIRLRYRRGGGSLWDVGCYPVRFMLALLETAPERVEGLAVRNSKGVDLSFAGQLLFSDQRIGQFYSSFLAPYSVGAEVICEQGRVVANDAWRAGLHDYPPRVRVEIKDSIREFEGPSEDPFLCEIKAFERLVQGNHSHPGNPASSRTLAATLWALHSASRKQRSLNVSV